MEVAFIPDMISSRIVAASDSSLKARRFNTPLWLNTNIEENIVHMEKSCALYWSDCPLASIPSLSSRHYRRQGVELSS